MVGCREGAAEDARRLGDVDIELFGATFGYLKARLSPLAFTEKACEAYGGGVHTTYVDCKEVYWSQEFEALVHATFITGENGKSGANSVRDDHRVYELEIDSHFRGTLCGHRIQDVMNSQMACGFAVDTIKGGYGQSGGIRWPVGTGHR
jgi:hypothetical protein